MSCILLVGKNLISGHICMLVKECTCRIQNYVPYFLEQKSPASISTIMSDPRPVLEAQPLLAHSHYDELIVTLCVFHRNNKHSIKRLQVNNRFRLGIWVGWGLTALLTQNRSYRACSFVGIFYSKLQVYVSICIHIHI